MSMGCDCDSTQCLNDVSDVSSENLILDQLTISLLIIFLTLITCLLGVVKRNFFSVSRGSERVQHVVYKGQMVCRMSSSPSV